MLQGSIYGTLPGTIVRDMELHGTLQCLPAGHHLMPAPLGTSVVACLDKEAPTFSEMCSCFCVPYVSDWNHHAHTCPSQKPERYLILPTACSSTCTQHPPSQPVTILSNYTLLICLWDFPSPHLLHLHKTTLIRIIISLLLNTCYTLNWPPCSKRGSFQIDLPFELTTSCHWLLKHL